MSFMSHPELLFALLCFLFGLIIGSFLNVVAIRTLEGKSIVFPPSACMNCETRLKPWDLVPVLSYVLLKGKCRYCKHPVSPAYPAGELLCGVLYGVLALHFGVQMELIIGMCFISILLVVVQTDLRKMIIPNRVVYFGIVTLALFRLFVHGAPLWHYAAAFLLGGGILYGLAVVSKGGMGGGDIKLFAMAGLVLGLYPLLIALFLSSLTGLLFGLIRKWMTGTKQNQLPFAPFIALGSIVAYLYGDSLIQAYLTYVLHVTL